MTETQSPTIPAAQAARYKHLQEIFGERYGPGPVRLFRTPGRINLIGEHTDYNGGFVMPVALDRDVILGVRARDDTTVRVSNAEPSFVSFTFDLSSNIPCGPQGDWRNYFQGAGQEICRRFGDCQAIKGMDVLVSGHGPFGIPRGAGLSSSTALTVSAALALVTLNEIEVDRADLAHLCSEAEWYVGTRGGMMDQFSTLLCRRDHALFLDCRPVEDEYEFDHVPIPNSVQIVLLNSGVHHENARGAFNQRVAECKIGVRLLQRTYPEVVQLRDVTPSALDLSESDFWAMLEEELPAQADVDELVDRGIDGEWLQHLIADHRLETGTPFAILPRCRHVIRENERVLAGVTALRAGQMKTFGLLMDAAHTSMSNDYAASCYEVDTLVSIVRQQPGVLGARLTGAGWGGGVVALVQRTTGAAWASSVQATYRASTGLDCTTLVCQPGSGASEVSSSP